MNWTSIIAIYLLFWVLSAFLVLPFGVRTAAETGAQTGPGHAESAPVAFRPGKVALRATVLSVVLFGLYYANYVNGWIQVDDVNLAGEPPSSPGRTD